MHRRLDIHGMSKERIMEQDVKRYDFRFLLTKFYHRRSEWIECTVLQAEEYFMAEEYIKPQVCGYMQYY